MKIHYTSVHKTHRQQHQAHTQEWRRQHIPKSIDTCSWCGGKPSKGDIHSDSCPVLFQISLVSAMLQAELRTSTRRCRLGETLDLAVPVLSTRVHTTRTMRDAHTERWRRASTHVEALCSGWASGLAKPSCQLFAITITKLSMPAVAMSFSRRLFTERS